jgi:IclR family acetate operon transcriptional repressor
MAVKRSQGVARALSVLELIAARQPIGVSALARLLEEDRSAVQRVVMTLADAKWIRLAPERPVRWELSAHIFTIAHLPFSSSGLGQRARRSLEELRDRTGETTLLAIQDVRRFIVTEVAESRYMLRMSTRIGEIISPAKSATGRAVLRPYCPILTGNDRSRCSAARQITQNSRHSRQLARAAIA